MGDIQQDPSMEEILASIKRVIAEDGREGAVRAAASTAAQRPARRISRAVEPPADEDVLELDEPVTQGPSLLSETVVAASSKKFASLSALRQRGETPPDSGALEAVVREMLKPMLKEWLDQRLPEIVEDLVTREIARLTGRDL